MLQGRVCVCPRVRIYCAFLGPDPSSVGLMPTEARGNYLPEPAYLRYTKTYHSHQPFESTRHAGNYFVPISILNTAHFYFFVAQVMSNYLTTGVLKKCL